MYINYCVDGYKIGPKVLIYDNFLKFSILFLSKKKKTIKNLSKNYCKILSIQVTWSNLEPVITSINSSLIIIYTFQKVTQYCTFRE